MKQNKVRRTRAVGASLNADTREGATTGEPTQGSLVKVTLDPEAQSGTSAAALTSAFPVQSAGGGLLIPDGSYDMMLC